MIEIIFRSTFLYNYILIIFLFQTDLRTIGKKFLPSDINGGKVEKVKKNIRFLHYANYNNYENQ